MSTGQLESEFEFSTVIASKPVKIDGNQYELREADADVAKAYRNAMFGSTKMSGDGKVESIVGMADIEPLLVSLSLFDSEGNAVTLETIGKWPSKIVKPMYEWVKHVSDLSESEESEKVKNEQSDGMDGSD